MGKSSLPSPTRLQEFAKVATKKLNRPTPETSKSGGSRDDSEKLKFKMENPQTPNRMPLWKAVFDCEKRWLQEAKAGDHGDMIKMKNPYTPNRMPLWKVVSDCEKLWFQDKLKEAKASAHGDMIKMENPQTPNRMPLSEVVSDCAKRWFQDTLKEAKAGDIGMQVLVGQMYFSGYGVIRDTQKGRAWIARASRNRSSVWRVSDKHPGYNASDSDSDELNSRMT